MDSSLYQDFFESSPNGMFVTNAKQEITAINAAFSRLTGYDLDEVTGINPQILASDDQGQYFNLDFWQHLLKDGYWQGEISHKRKDGKFYPVWQSVHSVKNLKGSITHFMFSFCDITPLKKNETDHWKQAHRDKLTGLSSRYAFELRLSEEISAAKRSGRSGVMLVFNLDDYSQINNRLGHKLGNKLLIDLANRLKRYLRREDVFARINGDEFAILLPDLPSKLANAAQAAGVVIKNMMHTIRSPVMIDGQLLSITASFGVTFFHPFADNAEEAFKQAEAALYASKTHGKNTYTFYHPAIDHPEMLNTAISRFCFESELREAIRLNQIILAYQPQYNQNLQILGYEALVRWRHPEKGLISPESFIPTAEESGVIIELGEKILLLACEQLADWELAGKHIPNLSINISPSQFVHANFIDMVLGIFKQTGINPAKITLELTENMFVSDMNLIITKMLILREHGVRFAIDDFGTGYSSLAYLQKMPIDQLKIDRSFFQEIANNDSVAIIVDTILAMANHLQLETIAEGVENEEQIKRLRQSGCKGFQGYWFSEPLFSADKL